MSIRLSNDSIGIKITEITSKNAKAKKQESSTNTGSWEFFKHIQGLVTEYLNKQINIPSTAITPAFVLTTKEAFSNIMIAIQVFSQLKEKIGAITELVGSSTENSLYYRKKRYVQRQIEINLRGW